HPAFLDHGARNRRGEPLPVKPCRVRSTFDFTLIQKIRNFDLTVYPQGSAERANDIAAVVLDLDSLPGRTASNQFKETAMEKLTQIGEQLDKRLRPDWSLIEPLIQIETPDGSGLSSSHGTHVAGILGADWRRTRRQRAVAGAPAGAGSPAEIEEIVLQGICPDIKLYDLRVGPPPREGPEFGPLSPIDSLHPLH